MQVLLIAESSEYFRSALADAFSADFLVHTCTDGYDALELLRSLRPDGLIINMSLAFKDGLSVLREADRLPPLTMALCTARSSYILHSLQQAGVSFIMPIPCTVQAVRTHFLELAESGPQATAFRQLQTQVSRLLNILGMPSHLGGYRMLCLAVALYHQDSQQTLTKEVYPAVAEHLGGNFEIPAIEHAIRSAISVAWRHRDSSLWREYFPKDKLPSNKQFISVLSQKLL